MAEMRTRKHKRAQTVKRQQMEYSLSDSVGVAASKSAVQSLGANSTELFGYSVDLIKKDILKTVIIGAIITALLIGIVVFGQ